MITIRSVFNTIDRIKELKSNLLYLETIRAESSLEIDRIDFVTPLSITPVAALINRKNLRFSYTGENAFYLNVIHFPEGINEISNSGIQKSYIPIIHLSVSTLDKKNMSMQLSSLHSKFLELLRMNVIADVRFMELISNNTFGFLLGEMLDNIEEHSRAANIYLFAQYWQKTNSCELCILDDGDGLYGSLKNAGRDVKNDYDAIKKILDTGLSAKTEYGDIRRGMGIKLTRASIANKEINGEFFIMSGNAAFLHSASQGEIFINFSNLSWNGTVVMMKLNRPVSSFNLYNYVR